MFRCRHFGGVIYWLGGTSSRFGHGVDDKNFFSRRESNIDLLVGPELYRLILK